MKYILIISVFLVTLSNAGFNLSVVNTIGQIDEYPLTEIKRITFDSTHINIDALSQKSYLFSSIRKFSFLDANVRNESIITSNDSIQLTVYPNPTNPDAVIRFQQRSNEPVDLFIYNPKGQLVRTWHFTSPQRKINTIKWNALDKNGSRVSSGTYIVCLKNGTANLFTRLTILK
ncbi:MAG: T9SS type A sorting domain-containing protein [Fibrobacteres bacterium]|nr:T9SS type A sorting domain-containing protein [Fibrobacterota bacterium]